MPSPAQWWLAKVEFGRVQTYLFAVSELKSMLGANTLLGELLRGRLGPAGFARDAETLPGLALAHDAGLPPDVKADALGLPEAHRDDPLGTTDDRDDPRAAYRQGVLARDGGHFHATFGKADDARGFVRAVRELIARRAPGLAVKARLVELTLKGTGWAAPEKGGEAKETSDAAESGAGLFDLPVFQVCTVAGQGPAAETDPREPDPEQRRRPVSRSVLAKRERTRAFDRGESRDVLGLLRDPLLQALGLANSTNPFPNQFEHVASVSGYLAVIAADGNGIGSRLKTWQAGGGADFFAHEARTEAFFHAMRWRVRAALVAALARVFAPGGGPVLRDGRLPFRLMMQGGDDLLLVCDAAFALPFARAYAEELRTRPLAGIDNDPIDVGIGVAVVKKKFPFHRSHALAEQLAASAKRLYRSLPKVQRGSVIDWLTVTEAWHEDVAEVRRRDTRVTYTTEPGKAETLLLSRKPYLVLKPGELPKPADLPKPAPPPPPKVPATSGGMANVPAHLKALGSGGKGTKAVHPARTAPTLPLPPPTTGTAPAAMPAEPLPPEDTLQALLESAGAEATGLSAARSQFVALAHALSDGHLQANWALAMLPAAARLALGAAVVGNSVWLTHPGAVYSTRVADWLEVYELERLRSAPAEGS